MASPPIYQLASPEQPGQQSDEDLLIAAIIAVMADEGHDDPSNMRVTPLTQNDRESSVTTTTGQVPRERHSESTTIVAGSRYRISSLKRALDIEGEDGNPAAKRRRTEDGSESHSSDRSGESEDAGGINIVFHNPNPFADVSRGPSLASGDDRESVVYSPKSLGPGATQGLRNEGRREGDGRNQNDDAYWQSIFEQNGIIIYSPKQKKGLVQSRDSTPRDEDGSQSHGGNQSEGASQNESDGSRAEQRNERLADPAYADREASILALIEELKLEEENPNSQPPLQTDTKWYTEYKAEQDAMRLRELWRWYHRDDKTFNNPVDHQRRLHATALAMEFRFRERKGRERIRRMITEALWHRAGIDWAPTEEQVSNLRHLLANERRVSRTYGRPERYFMEGGQKVIVH